MCSVQAAGGRELRAVVGGCWRTNSSPETSHPGEHLPVQGRGCSLQPFGSVGFGLPGHVDVCKEGTRSCDTARPSSPSPAPGHGAGADAHSPAREKRAPPHPHPFPPASGMSGACWGSRGRQTHPCTWQTSSFSFPEPLTIQRAVSTLLQSTHTNSGQLSRENSV